MTDWPAYFRALHDREDIIFRTLLTVGTDRPRARVLARRLVDHPLTPERAARLLLRAAARVRARQATVR